MSLPNDTSQTSRYETGSNSEMSSSGTLTPTDIKSPPPGTPTRNNPASSRSPNGKVTSDRFIPLRDHNNWQSKMALEIESQLMLNKEGPIHDKITYSKVLRNELFGSNNCDETVTCDIKSPEKAKLFQFMSPTKDANDENLTSNLFSLSPLSKVSRKILQTPSKTLRRISRLPYKILDAPELQDDFYLNLVDWSSQNVLGVGLKSSVYLWTAKNGQVTRLCDLEASGNLVSSVCWNKKGDMVSVGTHYGTVQLWDPSVLKKTNVLAGHDARIGSLAWNDNVLASGSRDRCIFLRDVRVPQHVAIKKLTGHRQEVCGLKWSPDGRYLASGGNDNRVFIWCLHSTIPIQSYTKHTAAVKALAWSPHHHGLLASGGGTADRCIRFWNTLTGQPLQVIDTESQVCNIAWSKNSSELVSTHGYTQNQICIWNYPSMIQVAKLTGHTFRVLYLAMSPSGEVIVTGAGDETLRFWNVFSKAPVQKERKSVLKLFTSIR